MEEHRNQGGRERNREVTVEETDEIPHDRGRRGDRPAGIHHDADAERLFAGGSAAVQRLEQSEIAPQEAEGEDDHPRAQPAPHPGSGAHAPDDRPAADPKRQESQDEQQQVEQSRGQA